MSDAYRVHATENGVAATSLGPWTEGAWPGIGPSWGGPGPAETPRGASDMEG